MSNSNEGTQMKPNFLLKYFQDFYRSQFSYQKCMEKKTIQDKYHN